MGILTFMAGEHIVDSGPFAGITVPEKGFTKIYADPPWGWRDWGGLDKIPHRGEVTPYLPMTKADLEALPVSSMASTHCALFMWTVSSHLDQAIDLMRAWHFTFRSVAFIWVKTDKRGRPRMGMGRWTRQEAEVCLIGTRGRPPRMDAGVRQVVMEGRREHSRKPDEIRRRIDRLVHGPGLELFSRESSDGWAAWGNEAGKFDGRETAALPTPLPRTDWPAAACVAQDPAAVCGCRRCADRRLAILQELRA